MQEKAGGGDRTGRGKTWEEREGDRRRGVQSVIKVGIC